MISPRDKLHMAWIIGIAFLFGIAVGRTIGGVAYLSDGQTYKGNMGLTTGMPIVATGVTTSWIADRVFHAQSPDLTPTATAQDTRLDAQAQAAAEFEWSRHAYQPGDQSAYSSFRDELFSGTNWTDRANSTNLLFNVATGTYQAAWFGAAPPSPGVGGAWYRLEDNVASRVVIDSAHTNTGTMHGVDSSAASSTDHKEGERSFFFNADYNRGFRIPWKPTTPAMTFMFWAVQANWTTWHVEGGPSGYYINHWLTDGGEKDTSCYVLANSGYYAGSMSAGFYGANQAGGIWLGPARWGADYPAGMFTNDVWYHFAATLDVTGKIGKWYVNGVMMDADTNATATACLPNNAVKTWAIGFRPDNLGDGQCPGNMDDVRLYNKECSAEEVAVVYAGIAPKFRAKYQGVPWVSDISNNMAFVDVLLDSATVPAATNLTVRKWVGSEYRDLALTPINPLPGRTNMYRYRGMASFGTPAVTNWLELIWSNNSPIRVGGYLDGAQ